VKKTLILTLFAISVVLLFGFLTGLLADDDKIESLKKEVEKLRGLKFKKDVPVKNMKKKEFREFLIKLMHEDGITKEKARDIARIGVKFGFYPESFDLYNATLNLISGAVQGFYDFKSKQIFMISDAELPANLPKAMAQVEIDSTILHELNHALDDQLFNIADYLRKDPDDRKADRAMAVMAILEGSALDAQLTWVLGQPSHLIPGLGKMICDGQKKRPAISAVPEAMQIELLWRYEGGIDFVHRLLKKGGQKELEKALKDPPVSTEQVLHIDEKYYKEDEPIEIKIDEKKLGELLPEWEFVQKDNLGELFTDFFLKQYVDEKKATEASEGWDGDLYAAFKEKGEKKKGMILIWLTVWDSEKDRNEFFNAYKQAVMQKCEIKSEAEGDSVTLKNDKGIFHVERKGHYVLCIDGFPDKLLDTIKKQVWSNVKEKSEDKGEKESDKKEENEKKDEGEKEDEGGEDEK